MFFLAQVIDNTSTHLNQDEGGFALRPRLTVFPRGTMIHRHLAALSRHQVICVHKHNVINSPLPTPATPVLIKVCKSSTLDNYIMLPLLDKLCSL